MGVGPGGGQIGDGLIDPAGLEGIDVGDAQGLGELAKARDVGLDRHLPLGARREQRLTLGEALGAPDPPVDGELGGQVGTATGGTGAQSRARHVGHGEVQKRQARLPRREREQMTEEAARRRRRADAAPRGPQCQDEGQAHGHRRQRTDRVEEPLGAAQPAPPLGEQARQGGEEQVVLGLLELGGELPDGAHLVHAAQEEQHDADHQDPQTEALTGIRLGARRRGLHGVGPHAAHLLGRGPSRPHGVEPSLAQVPVGAPGDGQVTPGEVRQGHHRDDEGAHEGRRLGEVGVTGSRRPGHCPAVHARVGAAVGVQEQAGGHEDDGQGNGAQASAVDPPQEHEQRRETAAGVALAELLGDPGDVGGVVTDRLQDDHRRQDPGHDPQPHEVLSPFEGRGVLEAPQRDRQRHRHRDVRGAHLVADGQDVAVLLGHRPRGPRVEGEGKAPVAQDRGEQAALLKGPNAVVEGRQARSGRETQQGPVGGRQAAHPPRRQEDHEH